MPHSHDRKHASQQAATEPHHTFKLLRFKIGDHDIAADATHLAHIRPASSLSSSTPVHELAAVLGLQSGPSSHIATFASPPEAHADELPPWIGLGEHVGIITCSSHNILVLPPWLGGHSSRHLLPACLLHDATRAPDALERVEQGASIIWLLDMTTLREHIYQAAFVKRTRWWQ